MFLNPVISHFPERGAAVARGVKIKGGKIGIREKGVRVVKFSLSSLHALLPASLCVWPAYSLSFFSMCTIATVRLCVCTRSEFLNIREGHARRVS